jgi:uncharacterized protein (DUF2141 family)
MNKRVSTIAVLTFMLFGNNLVAQQSTKLRIHINDFRHSGGSAVVNLFREHDDVPKNPFITMRGEIKNGVAEICFVDLSPGSYAAIVYHDENSNGILDHKFGFPNEPMGFSNNWKLSLFSGMPTFRKLKFQIAGLERKIEINVN